MGRMHGNRLEAALKDNRLYGIQEENFDDKDKSKDPYVTFRWCGHTGEGKGRIVIEVVYAHNTKQAAYLAGELARTKGDQELAIIACEKLCKNGDPIGTMQVWMINAINDRDPYMYSTHNGYHGERKSMQTNLVLKKSLNDYYKHNKSPKYKERLESMKTADNIHPDDVIEMFCAPDIVNGVPVMKKRIPVHTVLDEWFTASVKKYAMRKFRNKEQYEAAKNTRESERTQEQKWAIDNYEHEKYARANMLMMYYKLFGKNNRLDITATQIETFDERTNQSKMAIQIAYPSEEGFMIKFVAPDNLAHNLHYYEKTEPIFGDKRPVLDDTPRTPEEVAESGKNTVAKFYAKYGSRAGKQPGEE